MMVDKLPFDNTTPFQIRRAGIRKMFNDNSPLVVETLLGLLEKMQPDNEAVRRVLMVRNNRKKQLEKADVSQRDIHLEKLADINYRLRGVEFSPHMLAWEAIQVLGQLGDKRAIESLQAIQRDTSLTHLHRIVHEALEALGVWDEDVNLPAYDPLLEMLTDQRADPDQVRRILTVRDRNRERLKNLSDAQYEAQLEKLADIDARLCDADFAEQKLIWEAIEELEPPVDDDLQVALESVMMDTNRSILHRAVQDALQRILGKEYVPTPVLSLQQDAPSRSVSVADENQEFSPATIKIEDAPEQASISLLPDLEWLYFSGRKKRVRHSGTIDDPIRTITYEQILPEFKISKKKITNQQWQVFMDDPDGYRNPQWWCYAESALHHRLPAIYDSTTDGADGIRTAVSYYDALAFCLWMSEKTRLSVTLPTLAEIKWITDRTATGFTWDGDFNEWTVTPYPESDGGTISSSVQRMVYTYDFSSRHFPLKPDRYRRDTGFRIVLSQRKLELAIPVPEFDVDTDSTLAPTPGHLQGLSDILPGLELYELGHNEGINITKRIIKVRNPPHGTRYELPVAARDFIKPQPQKPRQDRIEEIRDIDDHGRFKIAERPITHAQFNVFLNDPSGYVNKHWWEYRIDAMRSRRKVLLSVAGAQDDEPRTMVDWYTALAFVFWIGDLTGEDIRLPSIERWKRGVERGGRMVSDLNEWCCELDPKSPVLFNWGRYKYTSRGASQYNKLDPDDVKRDLGFRLMHTGVYFYGLSTSDIDLTGAIKAIRKGDDVTEDHIYALAVGGHQLEVNLMVDALQSPTTREGAAFALGWLADRYSVPSEPLIDALRDYHQDTRDTIMDALIQIGESAIEPLQQALESEFGLIRSSVIVPLASLVGKDIVPTLIDILRSDPFSSARRNAAIQLGVIGDVQAQTALQQALSDEDQDVVISAKTALQCLR